MTPCAITILVLITFMVSVEVAPVETVLVMAVVASAIPRADSRVDSRVDSRADGNLAACANGLFVALLGSIAFNAVLSRWLLG